MPNLILTRNAGEKTIITVPPSDRPTEIVASIIEVSRGRVREAWEAPRQVRIHRQEVADAIHREAKLL